MHHLRSVIPCGVMHMLLRWELACNDKLVSALSPDPCTTAGILMAKGFIPYEIHAKMLLTSLTSHEKATILVTAIMEKIKVAPK